jgi:hypothetical protein
MGEDHAAATRECDKNLAPVRRKSISEVGTAADQYQPEQCCSEHTFPLVPPVSKTYCGRTYDGHEDRKHSMRMFFRGYEVGRDSRQREDHGSRDAMNKTKRRSDHSCSI